MAMNNIRNGKLLYHLTKLSNLESIIENNLLPRSVLLNERSQFDDVANPEIITKRDQLGLDSYTPFHFHPYSSFDVAVKSTYNNDEFVYICIERKLARAYDFKIIPTHPLSIDGLVLYDYDRGMEAIDWETMQSYGTEDEYAKHVKMAECLTNLAIPVQHFFSIAVRNEEVRDEVQAMLKKHGVVKRPPFVDIQCWLG